MSAGQPEPTDVILVLNAGSSTLKFSVFARESAQPLLRGHCDYNAVPLEIGVRQPTATSPASIEIRGHQVGDGPATAVLQTVLELIANRSWTLVAIGHRVVHGGPRLVSPVVVTSDVRHQLRELIPWAPLHQGDCLQVIDCLTQSHGHLPQVACFDTGFHATLPPEASTYALPRALTAAGLRRYGFHGLSYQSIAEQLPAIDPRVAAGRVIVAHLGSGASLCGLLAGRSQATTMGMTPLDGLPMATRCGALDPGIVLHLWQHGGHDAASLTRLLYRESGLKGVSGISGDLRTLLDSSDPAAQQAVALFVYRVVREIGSLAAALQGVDALVFTGGIGENSAEIRQRVCGALQWLGVQIDPDRNRRHTTQIDRGATPIRVFVLPAAEEALIARLTLETLNAAAGEQA
jgi:acetate kinase